MQRIGSLVPDDGAAALLAIKFTVVMQVTV
jgi:hypothetical protein